MLLAEPKRPPTRRPREKAPECFAVTNAECPKHDAPVWFDPATKALFCIACARVSVRVEGGAR